MGIEFITCNSCGRKNISDRTLCHSCNAALETPRKTASNKWPYFLGGVLVTLLVGFPFFYYSVISEPSREGDKTEKERSRIALDKQAQTSKESESEGVKPTEGRSATEFVSDTAASTYLAPEKPPNKGEEIPVQAQSSYPQDKPPSCQIVVNPRTGGVATASRLPANSGYIPLKVKPGSPSGSYIDPVTGRETYVALPRSSDPFVELARAYNIALCDRYDRGGISRADFDRLFNEMRNGINQERQRLAQEQQRRAEERARLTLELRKLEQERQRQILEWQRLATQQQASQAQLEAAQAQRQATQALQQATQAQYQALSQQNQWQNYWANWAQRQQSLMRDPIHCTARSLGGGMSTINCW